MTAIIRREIRRRVGAFAQGGGVYRRPIFVSRAYTVAVSTGVAYAAPGAGVVLVEGTQPLPGPVPGAGVIEVTGGTIGLLSDGQSSVRPGAGVVEVVGNFPVAWIPRRMLPFLRAAERRRVHLALYGQRHPLPDYDVIIPHTYQPPAYRIVQIGDGEVVVEGVSPSILADEGITVEAGGAALVLVEGHAPELLAGAYLDVGAAVVLVEGSQVKSSEIETIQTPGAGDVVVLGYNPSLIATGGYYRSDQQGSDWEVADTAVQSWGDIVVVTTIWTKQ